VSEATLLLKAEEEHNFDILKSDELVIGGYASIEMVDKQNDLITLEALNEAVSKFMKDNKYRNVMSNHSNVQVGEVIDKHRDKNGVMHKTAVDDVGFYVVIKMRDDIEKAKEIARNVRKGTLRSFSIGGQALSKHKRTNKEFGEYNEIDRLELHEVTICEKGINPEAKFDILKQEKGENKMTEKLEQALEELNDLMKQVNEMTEPENGLIKKDDDSEEVDAEEKSEYMDISEDDTNGFHEEDEENEAPDSVRRATSLVSGDSVETGYSGGKASENVGGGTGLAGKPLDQTAATKSLAKGWDNSEFATLDLSVENVEKAYEQFKAEELEKVAYQKLQTQFANRFASENTVRKESVDRATYDARNEVSTLREEFAELRKSLTEQNDTIIKSQEFEIPEELAADMAEMSWGDIHNLAAKYGE
jgi:HK97 family phage prohead protease